jgi:hypothetical protein
MMVLTNAQYFDSLGIIVLPFQFSMFSCIYLFFNYFAEVETRDNPTAYLREKRQGKAILFIMLFRTKENFISILYLRCSFIVIIYNVLIKCNRKLQLQSSHRLCPM